MCVLLVSRYLLRGDECGFSMQLEVLQKGRPVQLEFRNHVYAVLVMSGHGALVHLDGQGGKSGSSHALAPGAFFALNASDRVELVAESDELQLVRCGDGRDLTGTLCQSEWYQLIFCMGTCVVYVLCAQCAEPAARGLGAAACERRVPSRGPGRRPARRVRLKHEPPAL